ncbi:hypothetical protein M5J14_23005 [Lysinibacillus sp. OL1_EC]|uniref:hypothetical protein n=1 Tax=unclassified Lysinibacillus TaxID=2636778 RepID=UPI00103C4611|nr:MULTISPECIES: hypothetical protein [unclassified Lysinibacillus]MCM0627370.1 hypothetical protein [Lysinibacillus sp. OL1_EC]TBV84880.1 hypothetical protein EW028_23640 [Lysinibacillus sp. OL1]
MVYLSGLVHVSGDVYRVGGRHYRPFDVNVGLGKTKEELEQVGVLVDNLPEPKYVVGKLDVLYVNAVTKETYYEYVDAPLTEDEKYGQINEALGVALLENAADKVRIVELEKTQGELLMEVAMLKMGGNL